MSVVPYLIRPGRDGDYPFVLDSWLNANRHTARARELLAAGVYWSEHKATVRRLLRTQVLTVACDPADQDAILGWACTSEPPPDNPDPVIHYCYVKGKRGQSARRCGIAKALLAAFLPHPFTYTHMPAYGRLPIPEHAFYNPERMYRT